VGDCAVRVKVCGLTSVDQARACAELGADWVGLNFYPPSPRYIEPQCAAEIVAALPGTVSAVGVFADQPAVLVSELAARVGLSIVQLHGEEPPEELLALRHLRVVKAFRLESGSDWARVSGYLVRVHSLGCQVEAVLVDAFVPGLPGGTGRLIADSVFEDVPHLPRLILSGGLTPQNVAGRVARLNPWMVDVAGGVESAPGQKDLSRVAAFIAAARGAGTSQPTKRE
jgi:phosphoribosylanthranilate isomerase